MDIKIKQEFSSLIPPLSQSERAGLEASIMAEGCRDALVLWQGYIVDGHNRYAICTEHDIDFETVDVEFEDENAAKLWMIDNQSGRRNLTDGWRYELAQTRRNILLEAGKEKHAETAGREKQTLSNNDNVSEKHNTQAKVAETLGWSTGKTAQAQYVWDHAPKEVKEEVKSGEKSIHRAYTEIKTPHVSKNTGDNEWYTPSEYITAARRVMGAIDLDPASSEKANETVKASTFYTEQDNGLLQNWRGNVWMNPPYSSNLIVKFVDKLSQSFENENVKSAIVLVNNATETRWFGKLIEQASAVVFTSGRVKFLDPQGNPGAPLQGQAIVYLGDNPDLFISEFSRFGWGALCAV